MSRQINLAAHYARLLTRWPVDRLRPETIQFQRLLQARLSAATEGASSHSQDLSSEANAAYLLLDNTFSQRYSLSNKVMKPASRPALYQELAEELEEGPRRGLLAYMWKRVTSMVRRQ